MKQSVLRRIIASLIMAAILMGIPGAGMVGSLAETIILNPPQRNRVTDVGYIQNVYSREWYAKLNWDAMNFPPEAEETYITLGMNEIANGTGQFIPDAFTIGLPGSATGFDLNEYTPEGIRHGTIYQTYVRSSYKVNTSTGQYTYTSQKSNSVKVLTGLHVSVELIPGTNNIKIKWDDVWDTNGRINYRILISDTKGFTQPPAIPDIVASEIGKVGSAVTVNQQERKLEYIYTYAMPGREYSIKVVPLPAADVAHATVDEIGAVTIKTDILLKAQKVGYTNEGDVIWKLFWNPIVKGSTFTRVDYELYRYVNDEPQGQLFRLIPEVDSYQITIKKNDPNKYSFRIDAKAYVLGSEAPIEFRSNNKVELKEQIPQQPQAPELVEGFPSASPQPIYYEDLLTPNSASILWRVPYTGEGLIDTDVTYDIYLLENLQDVPNPPSNTRIASDFTPGAAHQVRDKITNEIIGYRYNLQGLKSNGTYYFVIYAKKSFLVQSPSDGIMITMPYVSKQAVKVIITKPDTGNDRPIAPPSPPFRIRPADDSIGFTSVTLMMDKKWHALYNSEQKKWEYADYETYIENELLKPGDEGYENKRLGMVVNYNPGWTIVTHAVKYNDALNVIRLRNNRDPEYITYSDLSQPDIKAFEIPQQRISIPAIDEDEEDQSFTFNLSGLTHNTAYLVWITIENQNGTASDPSDPLIITTPPDIPEIPVTPTVPTDLRGIAADSFIDLFWTFTAGMEYEIKGGTGEKLEQATITKTVTYQQLQTNPFCRVDGLNANTVYYFRIRAISRGSQGQVIQSEYSNPLVIKTEAFRPPAPPSGFGVKTGADGVTENSITYIWEALDGFSYKLEFADNAEFKNSAMINVTGNTHTVTGLIANRRYYARLYALERRTNLTSEPTRTVMVVTNKSKSEYDGSYDLDDPVTGDGLNIPAKLIDGVWTITSLGADAHVLAERIRSHYGPIVQIDLSAPPAKTTTVRMDLGSVVMDALADLKKELYVRLPWGQMLIRPGTFHTDEYFKQRNRTNDLGFRIEAVSPASYYKPDANMQLKSPVTDLVISYINSARIQRINRPIRVEIPINDLLSYKQGQIKTFASNLSQSWYALPTYTDYAQGLVLGELDKPGAVVAATTGVPSRPSDPVYVQDSLEKIQSVFNLKSLNGKNYDAKAAITQRNMLKLIMDVVPTEYTDANLLQRAVSAGLIKSASDAPDQNARRDRAVEMLVAFYKFKNRESVKPTKPNIWAACKDIGQVDSRYLEAFRFALENGIIQGDGSGFAYPGRTINYGDFLSMLERTLRLLGEL